MAEKEIPYVFEAGKGINAEKINTNFSFVVNLANDNEQALANIDKTALRKDGSNIEQDAINKFKQEEPILITGTAARGDIALTDNKTHFLSLTGNGKIILPTVQQDQYSHTITLIVDGGDYSLDVSNSGMLPAILTRTSIDDSKPYNVLYIYHKVHRVWYYYISQ